MTVRNTMLPLLNEIQTNYDGDNKSLVSLNSGIGKNTCFTQKRPGIKEIKVKVHDGLAERVITISSLDKHVDVLEKAAQAMR